MAHSGAIDSSFKVPATVFNAITEPLVVANSDSEVGAANRAWEEMSGYDVSKIISRPLEIFFDRRGLSRLGKPLDDAGSEPVDVQMTVVRKDGAPIGLELSVSTVEGEKSESRLFIVVAKHLPNLRGYESQLGRLQKAAMLVRVAGGIGVEFNNCVNGINMGLQLQRMHTSHDP